MTDFEDRDRAGDGGPADGDAVPGRPGPPPEWVVLPPPEVVATVATGAVPEIALDALRSVIVPVIGASGRIVDWELTFTGPVVTSTVATYWRWRRHWESRWAVGDVATLQALRDRVGALDEPTDGLVSLLDALAVAPDEPVAVDPRFGEEVLPALSALRAALDGLPERGGGIVDAMARPRVAGPMRTWVVPASETMVAATTTSSLWIDPNDGLVLVGTVVPGGRCAGIVSYDAVGREVVLRTREGEEVRVGAMDARPLAWLAPTCLRWSVVDLPVVEVFERTFSGLPAAFDAASTAGAPVRLTADVPIV